MARFKMVALSAVELLLFISCCLFAAARSGVGAAEGKFNSLRSLNTGCLIYSRRCARVLQTTHSVDMSVVITVLIRVCVRETVPVYTPTLTSCHSGFNS